MKPVCGSGAGKLEIDRHRLHISPLNLKIRNAGKGRNPDLICSSFLAPQHPLPVRRREGDFVGDVRKIPTIVVPGSRRGKTKSSLSSSGTGEN
jgi:hypothetical protein